jgi:hypothetical protein
MHASLPRTSIGILCGQGRGSREFRSDVEVVNDPDPAANRAVPAEFAGFFAVEGFNGDLGLNRGEFGCFLNGREEYRNIEIMFLLAAVSAGHAEPFYVTLGSN